MMTCHGARTRALRISFAVVVSALAMGARSAATLPEPVERAATVITSAELRAHLRFLASDELQGRGTGDRGPALTLTTGLHPDYHTPQDDVGRINFDKLEKIARLAFRLTWRPANDAVLPRYEEPNSGARATEQ